MRRFVVFLLLAIALISCRSARTRGGQAGPEPSASAPSLPPLVVRDDSTNLLFSYITLDGGFQTVKRVADVPYEARDAVRVWSELSGDGVAGPYIYQADLRNKLADGTYRVDVVPRASFEALATARREKAKQVAGKPATPPGGSDKPEASAGKKAPKVIIYGADWCKPCHAAEAWLKARGIPYEHKDIDEPENNEEMRDKLLSAGIKTHSIPVIDVGGKLLIGFSEEELGKAIAAAGG